MIQVERMFYLIAFFCWNSTYKTKQKNATRLNYLFEKSKHRRCCTVISIKCCQLYFVRYGIYSQLWRKSACKFLSVSFSFVYFLLSRWAVLRDPQGTGDGPIEVLHVVILQSYWRNASGVPHTEFELFLQFEWDCSYSCIQKKNKYPWWTQIC